MTVTQTALEDGWENEVDEATYVRHQWLEVLQRWVLADLSGRPEVVSFAYCPVFIIVFSSFLSFFFFFFFTLQMFEKNPELEEKRYF